MSTKHTPGPWHIDVEIEECQDGEGDQWIDISADQQPIVDCNGVSGWCGRDEQMANGRLIAAAPDLLEALEEMLAVAPSRAPAAGVIVGIEDRHANAILKARAAIAKATTTENKSKYPLIERGPFEAWWEDEGEDITFYCGDDPLAMVVAGWEAALKQPLHKAAPNMLLGNPQAGKAQPTPLHGPHGIIAYDADGNPINPPKATITKAKGET